MLWAAAVFTNFLALKRRLDRIGQDIRRVCIDFSDACPGDHTVLARLHRIADEGEWAGRTMELVGLEQHQAVLQHALAVRHKRRVPVPSLG